MRVLDLLHDLDVIKLDVEVLVHAFENTPELNVILELDSHLLVDQGFEET